MAYEVTLPVYSGPIDLLLHLITRQRVDIYEVSLATITEEYLTAMDAMDELDLETATGFLIVAATLLELKSARLLPSRGPGDADDALLEERDLLLARLVECATFRDAGLWMAAALESGAAYHGRAVGLEPRYLDLAPDVVVTATVEDLAALAANALTPRPSAEIDISHIAPLNVSVRDAIADIAGRLSRGGVGSLEELCADASTRLDVVVRFLALLELFKVGAVELSQTERFGAIGARWTGDVDAAEALLEVDEYAS